MSSRVTWFLSVFASLAAGPFGAEAQNRQKQAVTELSGVDEDFAFQGEYAGVLRGGYGGAEQQRVGVQVVALGDGKFDAMEYAGGLPGGGWNGIERVKLTGRRAGVSVDLEGWPLRVTIKSGEATVMRSAGELLGTLKKVQRVSRTMGFRPPPGGKVLFDGSGTEHFRGGAMTDDGLLTEGANLKEPYRDFNMHLEFRLPYMPHARGQGRANSGVYVQSRYEVQILDSFGLEGGKDECGALYKYKRPDLNMCYPPLSWQTYDIEFAAPRFDSSGEKVRKARITVWHNGILIHRNVELPNKTGGGAQESSDMLITKLQDHGNPVRFRNIWVRENNVSRPAQQPARPSMGLTGPVYSAPNYYSPAWPVQGTTVAPGYVVPAQGFIPLLQPTYAPR